MAWCIEDSGTGLYFKGVYTTFGFWVFFKLMIMACHWDLVLHFPVILVIFHVKCLDDGQTLYKGALSLDESHIVTVLLMPNSEV